MRMPALNREQARSAAPVYEIYEKSALVAPADTALDAEAEILEAEKKRNGWERKCVAVLVLALTVCFAIMLYSFEHRDPSFTYATNAQAKNLLGLPGAYVSSMFYLLFGFSAWWFVAAGVSFAWRLCAFRGVTSNARMLFHFTGFILLMGASCAFENLRFFGYSDYLPGEAGGLLGQIICGFLLTRFSALYTGMGLLAALVIGLRFYFDFSLSFIFEKVGAAVLWFLGGVVRLFRRKKEKIAGSYTPEPFEAEKPAQALQLPVDAKDIVSEGEGSAPSFPAAAPVESVPVSPQKTVKTARPNAVDKTGELFPETTFPLPELDWLDKPVDTGPSIDNASLQIMSSLIESKLQTFGVQVTVRRVRPGPVVTLYEIELAEGVKSSSVSNLGSDLARVLSVESVRIIDTVPGTDRMGIEAPNPNRQIVKLSEIIGSAAYQKEQGLPLCLGKRITGEPLVADLRKLPHLLVAGTTGSGKSVGVNAMLLSMMYRHTPDRLKFLLIDPKQVEFSFYEDIPYLITPVVTDMKKASKALTWCVKEMERRYRLPGLLKTRNIVDYNRKVRAYIAEGKRRLSDIIPDTTWDFDLKEEPFIVVVVDELADLLMTDKKGVEEQLVRLAQKARAASIHLILATQRPSTDIISGVLKANIPSRLAFQVATASNSRIILDTGGAESLLGMGDGLFKNAAGKPERVQAPFVTDSELQRVTDELRKLGKPDYIEDMFESEEDESGDDLGDEPQGVNGGRIDPLFDRAVQLIIENKKCSITMLQRRLGVGYPRAANIVDQLEEQGVVSKPDGAGRRTILARAPEEGL